jgi:hypothetical protein
VDTVRPYLRITFDPWHPEGLYAVGGGALYRILPAGDAPPRIASNPTVRKSTESRPATVEIDKWSAELHILRSDTEYKLAQDIKCLRGYAFVIPRGSRNIVFDGQGHLMECDGTAFWGEDVSNITIRNVRMTAAARGWGSSFIEFYQARHIKILNNEMTKQAPTIEGLGGISVEGVRSESVEIRNNRVIINTRLAWGIQSDAKNLDMSRNTIVAQQSGIRVNRSPGCRIEHNQITLTKGNQMAILLDNCPDARLAGNDPGTGRITTVNADSLSAP